MLDFESLLDRTLLLVTGKGGIGKSFVSSLLATYAARQGKSVLIIQSASCDQISPYIDNHYILADARRSTRGGRIEVMNLSGEDNFREYVVKYLGQKMLYDKVFSNKVVKTFISTIPGFAEVMLLGRMFYTCELAGEKRDLVIFDGFASGHFLSLMTTPDAVIDSTLGGPLVKETTRVKEFLADEAKTGTLFVTAPEDLVISETLEFLPKLQKLSPSNLVGLMVNRVLTTKTGHSEKPYGVFMNERRQKVAAAMATLQTGLKELEAGGLHLPTWGIPEYPTLGMPLANGFVDDVFKPETLDEYWT